MLFAKLLKPWTESRFKYTGLVLRLRLRSQRQHGFQCGSLLRLAAWIPLFFGRHSPGIAFAEITLLWQAIAATLAAFRPVSRAAVWLLAPQLAWVSFATLLKFTLWRLNS